jgi:YVTN family beta-propeller protein
VANSDATPASVSVINTASNTVMSTIYKDIGLKPTCVVASPDKRAVFVTNNGSASVSVIDALRNEATGTFPVGKGPTGVAVLPSGTRGYVVNSDDKSVTVFRPIPGQVLDTITRVSGSSRTALQSLPMPGARTSRTGGLTACRC